MNAGIRSIRFFAPFVIKDGFWMKCLTAEREGWHPAHARA